MSADSAWGGFAGRRFRLQVGLVFEPHQYRGERWVVAHDPASGRSVRLSPGAYRVLVSLDGRTLEDAAAALDVRDEEHRDEIVAAVRMLLGSELLVEDSARGTGQLLQRRRLTRSARRQGTWRSPLAIRIPIVDPDRFLDRTVGGVAPLLSFWGAAAWVVLVVAALVAAGLHWESLTENVTDRVLATSNVFLLGLVFPVIKAFHELGHAYATKAWGGEVHEMGILLIVFFPVPYVDASAASAFSSKRRRCFVGAAGMIVELVIASWALFLWVAVEPGILRSAAYNAILIASVSTVIFNANPLLRFDGYYIFSDLIEMPNLASRALRCLGDWIHLHGFGVRRAKYATLPRSEKGWLITYAIASFVYRSTVLFGIVLFVAGKYFFVGVLLAVWAGVGVLLMPVYRQVRHLLTSQELGAHRPRALLVTGGVLAVVVLLLVALPMPMRTVSEGVVWLPEDAWVRAESEGFADEILVPSDAILEAGQPILRLRNAEIEADVALFEAQLREAEVRYHAERARDYARAQLTAEVVDYLRERLAQTLAQREALTIRSPRPGRVILSPASDLPGRFFSRGEVVGWVVEPDALRGRVVVDPNEVDLVRRHTRAVSIRLSERLGAVLPARLVREIPAATRDLPSAALGVAGGGALALDPSAGETTQAFERLFQFELEIEVPPHFVGFGQRIHVRFDHGTAPLARQWYRALRQLFLARFDV